jgi:hypothetical protein
MRAVQIAVRAAPQCRQLRAFALQSPATPRWRVWPSENCKLRTCPRVLQELSSQLTAEQKAMFKLHYPNGTKGLRDAGLAKLEKELRDVRSLCGKLDTRRTHRTHSSVSRRQGLRIADGQEG